MNKNAKTGGVIIAVIIIAALAICAVLFFNTKDISDIKNSDYIGKTVKVRGVVENTIKIGSLSGYTLKDETESISVSSQNLPKEGDKITVKGTLIKDTLLGFYIKVD